MSEVFASGVERQSLRSGGIFIVNDPPAQFGFGVDSARRPTVCPRHPDDQRKQARDLLVASLSVFFTSLPTSIGLLTLTL